MQPDFLCIGAQKAGTSWLYNNLKSHPDIWLPPVKEIHYFNNINNPDYLSFKTVLSNKKVKNKFKGDIKKLDLASFLWDMKYFFGKNNDEWYLSLFQPPENCISGDITPAYSTLDIQAVRYVHRMLPDAKIILILRDPMERAWSHAKMDIKLRLGPFKDANGDISRISEQDFVKHFTDNASLLRGDYLRTINNWLNYYPPEQLFIAYHEDIKSNANQLLINIFNFLGLDFDQNSTGKADKVVNPGQKMDISDTLKKQLAEIYHPKLCELCHHLPENNSPYPEAWKAKAELILN